MISRQLVMSTAIVLALSACSGKTFKQFEVAPGAPSLSVDATQRFLLVKTTSSGDVIVCAEPSPDATMAVAAQIAGSGVLPSGLQAGVSGARSEALASLGLRTPANQLVRDLWYRACEGYINGVHDKDLLNEYAAKVDRLIAALAAFDAVANTPVAPAVAIGQVGAAESTTEASITTNATDGGATSGKTGTKAGTQSTTITVQQLPASSNPEGAAAAITEIFRMFLEADVGSGASFQAAGKT
jgi:hypothetical protein